MTPEDYLKFLFALIFVLALMGGLAILLKRLGLAGDKMIGGGKRRLQVMETLPLDSRRKIILLRKDDTEHLVILGIAGETVIETTQSTKLGHRDDTASPPTS